MTDKAEEYLPDMPRQIDREIHDHEVMLSFNSDDHAYAFDEWWGQEGQQQFLGWVTLEHLY